MGVQYDGDPRIGFIEVGTLGFWGEWHTYPKTNLLNPSLSAISTAMTKVLNAYQSAFTNTQLAVSADQIGYTAGHFNSIRTICLSLL
jgi:hypothetical protein